MEEYVTVTINKPIHGTFVSIDKRKLDEAARTGRNLKITILGVGSAVVTPQWWFETAVKKEKRVVNYIDRPMMFVYNHLPIADNFKKNKDISEGQERLF